MSQLEPSSNVEPEKTVSGNQNITEVAIGFFGWYLVNGLVWFLGGRSGSGYPYEYGSLFTILFFMLPGNIVVLLVFAIAPRMRRVALGMLIAMALNFVISLLLGLMFNAYCFVPFFYK